MPGSARGKSISHLLSFGNRVYFAFKLVYMNIVTLNKSPRNEASVSNKKHISIIIPDAKTTNK